MKPSARHIHTKTCGVRGGRRREDACGHDPGFFSEDYWGANNHARCEMSWQAKLALLGKGEGGCHRQYQVLQDLVVKSVETVVLIVHLVRTDV